MVTKICIMLFSLLGILFYALNCEIHIRVLGLVFVTDCITDLSTPAGQKSTRDTDSVLLKRTQCVSPRNT